VLNYELTRGIFDLPDWNIFYNVEYYSNTQFTHYLKDTCKPYFTVGLNSHPYYFISFSFDTKKDTICGERFFYIHYDVVFEGYEPLESSLHENTDDGISWELNNIYTHIYNRFYPEFIDEKFNFYAEDITEDNILNKFRDKFSILISALFKIAYFVKHHQNSFHLLVYFYKSFFIKFFACCHLVSEALPIFQKFVLV